MKSTHVQNISLKRNAIPVIFDMVQFDTGNIIALHVRDVTIPGGTTAKAYFQKPSGHIVYKESGITVSGQQITIPVDNQAIAEVGDTLAQVTLYNGSDTLSTFDFTIKVYASRKDWSIQNSETVISAFDEAVENAIAEIAAVLDPTLSLSGKAAEASAVGYSIDATRRGAGIITPEWNSGYIYYDPFEITESTVYSYTSPILIEPMTKYIFDGVASTNVCFVSLCDAYGNLIKPLKRGSGISGITHYEFYSDTACHVTACVKSKDNSSGMWTDLKDVVIKKEPLYFDYRVPVFSVGHGFIGTNHATSSNENFRYSGIIELFAGETIEFYCGGSTGLISLSEWDMGYNYIQTLFAGVAEYGHKTYTADHHMYVRHCGKIAHKSRETGAIITEKDFLDVKIYYKTMHCEKSVLNEERIVGIGDSLMHGNRIGTDAVWLNILGINHNAIVTNIGINGNTVAVQSTETANEPMCVRIDDLPADTDYMVLIGGANDKRLNVPIGDITDGKSTFKGALAYIVDKAREINPKIKLLFLTNYNRYPSLNALNLSDIDYVNAMLEVCAEKCVKCFDNYHNSGMTFQDSNMLQWCDEGISLDDSANHHLSPEAYKWIYPVYESLMLSV